MENTILELVDRLVATNTRMAIAERELEAAKTAMAKMVKEQDEANEALGKQQTEIIALHEKIDELYKSINWWANRANKFEAELKELKKDDTDGS